MSKTKRIISFLLTVVMIFSMTSVGVNAYYSAYKDNAIIDKYNSVDQPILTTQQYASMALDEVDRLLAKEQVIIPIEMDPFINKTLDFTSIDKAFDSITEMWGMAESLKSQCGDLKNLNLDAITASNAPRRAGATSSDVDVIKAIVKLLKDNSAIIKKAVIKSGSSDALSLGLIDSFYKLDLDVPNMIKGMVYKLAYDQKAPKVVNESMDDMLQVLLDKTFRGDLDPDTGEYTGFLPELAGVIDIDETSFYDLLDKAIRILYNSKARDLLDGPVRKWVKKSVADDPSLALLINTDYVVPTINFNSWGNGETLVDHFNDVLGDFFMALAKPSLGLSWNYSNGNNGLFDNLVHAAKKVFGETGGAFFLDYIEVIDPATFPDTAEGDEQFLAYVARSLINAFIDYINVPNTLTTLVEVANYTLRELAGDYIPSQYNNYAEMDLTDLDTAFEIGADFAVYFLSQTMDMGLDYDDDFTATLKAIVNWGVQNYGGLVASSSGTGWARLNSIFFQVFNSSWLPNKSNGSPRNDLESIIKDDIIGNLFNLNLKGILDLFAKNPTGELNQSVTYILVSLFKNIINMVFGSGTAVQYANFETMITANSASDPLPTLVQNIINNLYTRCIGSLLPALLPIVCSALDLSSPQEFEYPYISLGDYIRGATSFYIYNESSGINTAATDAEYDLHQDQLYKYRIRSISTNQSSVTVKYNGNAVSNLIINGGDSAYFNITGSFTTNTLLVLTVKYDILGEDGSAITTSPIEQKLYTYVTNATDDSDQIVNVDLLPDDASGSTLPNRHKGSYYKTTYINSYVSPDDKNPTATKNKKLRDLLDVQFTLKRKGTDDDETHLKAATITLGSNTTINSTLAANGVSAGTLGTNGVINTTKNGGNWNVNPYAVADGATLPADGVYSSNFYYVCSPTTGNANSTETLQFSHNVVIYNNANLPSLVNSAVKANRQASNYDTSNKVYSYDIINEYGEEETMTTTGPEAWDYYTAALEEAITRVYAPKQVSSYYGPAYIAGYTTMSNNLKEAITALEACVKQGSGGVSALKEAVEDVVPTNIDYSVDPIVDPETGEEEYTYYKFYEDEYQFFSMCDYVPYTYLRFRNEKKAADKLINSKDTVDAVKLSYTTHRFNLYADRLLRVVAYNDALLAVVNQYGGISEQGNYSQTSWNRYVIARDFAAEVAQIPLDDQDYIILPPEGEDGYVSGLRQSMVNKARGELILAYKMLVENADYTALNNAIANAASILLSDKDKYTTASWTAFQNALNSANSLSRNLAKTVDNQNLIERIAAALNTAVAGLKLKAIYTALDNVLAQAASYTNSALFTEDSWNDFTEALALATGVNRDLDSSQQQLINNIVAALSQAIADLVYLAQAGIEAIAGATGMGTTLKIIDFDAVTSLFGDALEDPTFGYIFGFDYWDPTIDGLIEPTAGATVETTVNDQGAFSTGAEVIVYDADGLVVATYSVVIFGDIDGSGFIDDADGALLEDAVGMVAVFADGHMVADNAYYISCDLNFDNWVDDLDPPIFEDYAFDVSDQSYNIPE